MVEFRHAAPECNQAAFVLNAELFKETLSRLCCQGRHLSSARRLELNSLVATQALAEASEMIAESLRQITRERSAATPSIDDIVYRICGPSGVRLESRRPPSMVSASLKKEIAATALPGSMAVNLNLRFSAKPVGTCRRSTLALRYSHRATSTTSSCNACRSGSTSSGMPPSLKRPPHSRGRRNALSISRSSVYVAAPD